MESQKKYPALAEVARKVFGITATSTSVEKLFSGTGRVCAKGRNIEANTLVMKTVVGAWGREKLIAV